MGHEHNMRQIQKPGVLVSMLRVVGEVTECTIGKQSETYTINSTVSNDQKKHTKYLNRLRSLVFPLKNMYICTDVNPNSLRKEG